MTRAQKRNLRSWRPALLGVILAAAGCGQGPSPMEEIGRSAQAVGQTPGEYGPVYAETGFHEKGDYFKAGFDAVVNRFGGNLIISARDASIPSIGKFGLAFSRTWNSQRSALQQPGALAQADSPLGLGWIGHYGLLWTTAPGQSRPEWVDSSGARHVFYPHTLLAGALPIPSAAPPPNQAWISPTLEILVRTSPTSYTLYTPGGLRYELTQPANTGYAFFVPTQVTDESGNSFALTYKTNVTAYFEHPLVESVRDDLGRHLDFTYGTPPSGLGRQRLTSVGLNGATIATYQYQDDPLHSWSFLWKHVTAEGRATEYTTDTAALPAFGTIRRITAPSGGTSEFDYRLIGLYFQVGSPRFTYAVETVRRGGHTFRYQYLNAAGAGAPPVLPGNNEFTVTQSIDGVPYGTYVYYTHGAACDPAMWQIGSLLRSTETWQGTTRTKTLTYAPFAVSQQPLAAPCPNTVAVTRLTSSSVTQDGATLTTSYSNHDSLNFPGRIVSPGGVQRDRTYHHVATGSGGGRLLLGQTASEETRQANQLVGKSVRRFNPGAVAPDRVQLFRDSNQAVELVLAYSTRSGEKGALASKAYGSYVERYTYQNGVLAGIDYPTGPDLSRDVATNGTITREAKDGVTRTFTWDRDARPTSIASAPDAPVTITYQARPPVATLTRGTSRTLLTHDGSGRLSERRETVDGAVDVVKRWGALRVETPQELALQAKGAPPQGG